MVKKYIHLSLACDDPHVPQLISSWLLGIPPQHEPPLSFFSSTHKTNVCTVDLMSFLTVDVIVQDFREKKFYLSHQQAVREIHVGKNYGKV